MRFSRWTEGVNRPEAHMEPIEGFTADELDCLIETALREDVGTGDTTTQALVPPGTQCRGVLVAGGWGVVAGMPVVEAVLRKLDPRVDVAAYKEEGQEFQEEELLARVCGDAAALLTGERIALNFLQRLCGIASLTRLFVKRLRGTHTVVLDTRKTTPGLRTLEKYAVRVGGGQNHRVRLDDMVLIKDNHLKLVGGIAEAVEAARHSFPDLKVEVEVGSLDELAEALDAGPDRVMLDNMTVRDMTAAVSLVRDRPSRIEIEASGGISLNTVRQVAATGVDFVSVGALTHSAPACEISFEVEFER
jgi:nicotinate-nucleotide pyrophosphorylase (carboxylating)